MEVLSSVISEGQSGIILCQLKPPPTRVYSFPFKSWHYPHTWGPAPGSDLIPFLVPQPLPLTHSTACFEATLECRPPQAPVDLTGFRIALPPAWALGNHCAGAAGRCGTSHLLSHLVFWDKISYWPGTVQLGRQWNESLGSACTALRWQAHTTLPNF